MKRLVPITLPLLLVLGSLGSAHAEDERFAEFVGGLMVPLAEDDYENFIDPSLKLGARFAFFGSAAAKATTSNGLELGFDWTPAANDLDDAANVDASFHRLRGLVALRVRKRIGTKTIAFVRAGGGIDYVIGSIETTILVPVRVDDNDLGLALEVGGGMLTRVGSNYIGVQAALPIAIHFGDEDELDYDYTGFDFDILFTAATTF